MWAIDALECPFCGGRMRIIAAIHDPDAIAAVRADRWSIPATGPPTESAQLADAAA